MQEVERCVLEPGGTFYVQGKTPPKGEVEHAEVVRRLDDLSGKLDLLVAQKGSVGGGDGERAGGTHIIGSGGMAERLKAAVLKTVSGVTHSGVRIPLPPQELTWTRLTHPS